MVDKTSYILSKFDKAPNSKGVIHTHCPFHDDSRPSFSIDVDEGLFFCGSSKCGLRGNFPLFYKLMEGIVDWKQVFSDLKEVTSNYDLGDLFSGKKYKTREYSVNSFPDNSEPLVDVEFLTQRGITSETISAYGLMYGKGGVYSNVNVRGTILAPVWDIDYVYKTFQVRYLSPKSKLRWLNPENSPIQNLLYGGWVVSPEDSYLWIVEGASDCWRMHSLDQKSVGLNTKEASAPQLNKIVKLCRFYGLKPVVFLDGDASITNKKGANPAEKLYNELMASGVDPMIYKLNIDEDPGGLSYERFSEIREELGI